MENKILGQEIPTLTIKESRKIANIIRNDEEDLSLASKIGASTKLHSTVDILSEDINVVDTSIKKSVKEEIVYTTIFDHGVEGIDKDKVVYTTEEGDITLVKKVPSVVNIKYKSFNAYCRELLSSLLIDCSDKSAAKALIEALPFCTVSFSIDKDCKAKIEEALDKGTIPTSLVSFVTASKEAVPMFDILYTSKEGGEE
jgi:hypothetical protein